MIFGDPAEKAAYEQLVAAFERRAPNVAVNLMHIASQSDYRDVIPYIRGVPVMETWVDIEDTFGQELERAFYGEATVDEILEAACNRTREFFTR